ncbi:MAG: Crp/Fnr family transcriptional regulator [Acidobacteriota bacterium]
MSTGDDRLAARIQTLQQTELFRDLDDRSLLPLARRAREIDLPAGAILFSAGEPAAGLFIVRSGRTKAVRQSWDGREQVIHEDGPGRTFPEVAVFDGGPYPSTVVAVEPSRLLLLPRSVVLDFCRRHPEVALRALRILSQRLRRATSLAEDLALRDVSQRLADYLLEEARRAGADSFALRHSNQEIAELIGSVREVVSRTFARLQRRGWIEKSGRRVRLVAPGKLAEHAEAH